MDDGSVDPSGYVRFFQNYQGQIEKTLLFLVIFVLVGLFARALLRRVVCAVDPVMAARGTGRTPERATQVWLALVSLVAWFFAFVVAGEVIGLHQALEFFVGTARIVCMAAAVVVVASLAAYSFSKDGHELLLSILGCWYLKRRI